MFRRTTIGQREAMLAALDSFNGRDDIDRVLRLIRSEADEIKTLSTDKFVNMIHKLLLVDRVEGAKKLVNALGDTEPTWVAMALVGFVAFAIKAIPVIAIVLFVVWCVR